MDEHQKDAWSRVLAALSAVALRLGGLLVLKLMVH
jgi:hypothetical protein